MSFSRTPGLSVHCSQASDRELGLLAGHGGVLMGTPEAETAQMGVMPVIGRVLRHGVPVILGADAPAVYNGDCSPSCV